LPRRLPVARRNHSHLVDREDNLARRPSTSAWAPCARSGSTTCWRS